jgi:hypothetical protein
MASRAAFELPDTKKLWGKMRKLYPEKNGETIKSASKIEIEQYLGLKILWDINGMLRSLLLYS